MNKRYGHLLKVLGVAFGWSVTVGNSIGAGILRAPGEVAQRIPSYSLFFAMWVAGAAFAMFGALSLAELGAMIPKSGGQTVFARRAFGPFPGFAVAWSDWLSTCASTAAITIVLVDSLVAIRPALGPSRQLIITALIGGFTLTQWRGIRAGSGVQLATSALKTLAFGALIIACFAVQPAASTPAAAPAAAITFVGVILVFQTMIYTYDGWAGVLYFSGEITDPGRDIPRSMFSGIISVAVIYLLLNAAFLHLLPLHVMAGKEMVADDASRVVFGAAGTSIIRALIAVSLLSAINSCILMGSRILHPVGLRVVNAGGTPTAGLALTSAVSLAMALSGTFNTAIAMAAFFFVANYATSFAAVFRLRATEPDTPRPYRAWGYPFTTAFMLLVSAAFMIAAVVADPRNSTYAILMIAVSYPIYRALRKRVPELVTEAV